MKNLIQAQTRLSLKAFGTYIPTYSFSSSEKVQKNKATSKTGTIDKLIKAFTPNDVKQHLNRDTKAPKDIPVVPWFPTKLDELDAMGGELIKTDEESHRDHPSFTDPEYRKRRDQIAENCKTNKKGEPIPVLDYLPSELATWKTIYQKVVPMHEKIMCKQYRECFKKIEDNCGMSENNIPQLRDLSRYLTSETGFRMKPVHGILSQREFLNALAFRVFCCTQYIRHHKFPFYTPEPDVVHEIMGHVPMFADKSFADMSQMIGLLSIGANENDIKFLAAAYWFTVEFGACLEGNELKAYGAGIAPCVEELENFVSDKPVFKDFEVENIVSEYPLQSVQPLFLVAKSFEDAKAKLIEFGEKTTRPFRAFYDEKTETIKTDREVIMRKAEEKAVYF